MILRNQRKRGFIPRFDYILLKLPTCLEDRKEASRLVFLIDDMIRLSQLDEGAEMPREEVSLKVLSEEICETLADAAKMKDVSLEVTGDDDVVNGVCRLLYEVVYNLCDNAIKYNKLGGT